MAARPRSGGRPRARPSAASRAPAARPSSRSGPAWRRSARAVTSSRSSSRAARTRSASVTTPQLVSAGQLVAVVRVDDDRVDAVARHHPCDRPQRSLGRARDHPRVHRVDYAELLERSDPVGGLEHGLHLAPPFDTNLALRMAMGIGDWTPITLRGNPYARVRPAMNGQAGCQERTKSRISERWPWARHVTVSAAP